LDPRVSPERLNTLLDVALAGGGGGARIGLHEHQVGVRGHDGAGQPEGGEEMGFAHVPLAIGPNERSGAAE
jgi:hypothetical protein